MVRTSVAPADEIAADNPLDGDVLIGLDLVPDGDGNGLAEVFQRLLSNKRADSWPPLPEPSETVAQQFDRGSIVKIALAGH